MTRALALALAFSLASAPVSLQSQPAATQPKPGSSADRFTYLDSDDPFWPDVHSPKLITPQWIGEDGVDAVIILAIDDMRENTLPKYEAFLRPILEELKRDGGRAPLSIMTCTVKPDDPQLQSWIREGVSIDVHTLKHPCPLLQTAPPGNTGILPALPALQAAKETVDGCIDLLGKIPNNKPVAFRTPCCDSMSTPSPRVFSEILCRKTTPAGNFLTIDSSVMTLITPNDKSLPREIVYDKDGRERFRKYFPQAAGSDDTPIVQNPPGKKSDDRSVVAPPKTRKSLANFGTYIENYPYPYVINGSLWEFPCMVPSDWEAFNLHGANNPVTVEDWKAALDAVVLKQGVFTFIFHPHGWIKSEQMVEFIRHARNKYGKRVKFLNFMEAGEKLHKNLLAGIPLVSAKPESNEWSIIADVDGDGLMDVITGRGPIGPGQEPSFTRIWQPKSRNWKKTLHRVDAGMPDEPLLAVLDGETVSLSPPTGVSNQEVTILNYSFASPFDLQDRENTVLTVKLERKDPYRGVLARDFDKDGSSELLVSAGSKDQVFQWSSSGSGKNLKKTWKPSSLRLPDQARVFDAKGRDNGLRFIDLNGDGYDDIVFSNSKRYCVYLFNSGGSKNAGRQAGWTLVTREGKAGDANSIPQIVRADGTNNGVWFKHGSMWVQNEDTSALPDKVRRITFEALLRQP